MCATTSTQPDFTYINEDAIDRNLKCTICTNPFRRPVKLCCCPHTFCKGCLKTWLKKKNTCPLCCKEVTPSSGEIYQPIEFQIVRNQLDELLVQCTRCLGTNIQRGHWKNHLKSCPKYTVYCPSILNECKWRGPRESLVEHVNNCAFEKVRPVIDELKGSIKKLEKKVKFLLNVINHGDIMKKRCTKPSECKYEGSQRSSEFTCCNCRTKIAGKEISIHACTDYCICESCVDLQYSSSEVESLTESSDADD